MEEVILDDIIKRLVEAKNGRVPKQAQITEPEIRQLCVAAKDVFLSQPNLLELEAPIKICGNEITSLEYMYCIVQLLFRLFWLLFVFRNG